MNKLIPARESPRIANGVLKWYAGDTFQFCIQFDLVDQFGQTVTIGSGHTIEVVFQDPKCHTVKTFSFENVSQNCVMLSFDETCTKLFPQGEYTYDIFYTGDRRVTLAQGNPVVVE